MTEKEIHTRYLDALNTHGQLTALGYTKHQVAHFKRSGQPLGTKLEILYRLGQLRFRDGWDEDMGDEG